MAGEMPAVTMKNLLDDFLRCRWRLARMVGRIVRPDEIEDIVQEAFVTSYAASRRQDIRNPQAFMMRVARNIALDHIGKAERRLNCSLEDTDESELISELGPEGICQSEEYFLEFCRAVARLPPSCRRVFILKKVYGMSLQEIGALMGTSTSTVENQITKGFSIVVEQMLKSGHTTIQAQSRNRGGKRN